MVHRPRRTSEVDYHLIVPQIVMSLGLSVWLECSFEAVTSHRGTFGISASASYLAATFRKMV